MRTTAAEVKEILDNTSLSDAIVDAFIKSANLFVTDTLEDSGLSDDVLEDIERWVAAHLISYTRDRQSKKEEAGSAKVEYAGNFNGVGLNGTSYGQMAIILDSTKTLKNLQDGRKQIFMEAL